MKLGTMAVGTEKKIIATVRNVGSYPLVFFIAPVPEQYGNDCISLSSYKPIYPTLLCEQVLP